MTALAVERAHREGQPVMLCDGGGLYFRKQNRDGAAWTLRYRFAGRARWMTLGNYPDMTLADTRVEAREKRAMLDRQRDPLLEKQAVVEQQRAAIVAQKARGTFPGLAEDWYDTEIEGQRLKHPQVPRRHLDNYLLPEFGDWVPAEITPADSAAQSDMGRIRFRMRHGRWSRLVTSGQPHEDRPTADDSTRAGSD
jgi:hypothetical protein